MKLSRGTVRSGQAQRPARRLFHRPVSFGEAVEPPGQTGRIHLDPAPTAGGRPIPRHDQKSAILSRVTPLATTIVERLTSVYPEAADPVRAVSAAAYMRNQFVFLGIPNPQRIPLSRRVLAGIDKPDEADLRDVADACWRLPEREYQYFACGLLRRYVGACSPRMLGTLGRLITTRSWWDTVDTLAAGTVGPLVRRDPTLVSTMDEWVMDDNIWLARAAILHQLTYKQATDAPRLFQYCLTQAGHRDFFIRKAIGWALRQYARTDPGAVRSFLAASGDRLSPLSVREASKHL
jgi:3-methyladenine DNA glycosylase AlkD